jgi:hypothetical protein
MDMTPNAAYGTRYAVLVNVQGEKDAMHDLMSYDEARKARMLVVRRTLSLPRWAQPSRATIEIEKKDLATKKKETVERWFFDGISWSRERSRARGPLRKREPLRPLAVTRPRRPKKRILR